ncbi:MAG: Long-chain-fatty-acid--CoA ligase [Rubritepida sp.]|nr:Long-chain-fatty-acid--CoA ligase [Rubritepida sp.]
MANFRNLGALIEPGLDGGKPAVVDLSRGTARTFSYAELDAMADAAARGLLARGLVRGDRVGLLAANSAEFLAVLYGAQRAGLIPVPVNWRFPPHLVDYVLRDSGAKLVLHDAARRAALPPELTALALEDWAGEPGPFTPVTPEPREPAIFLYTSGSTGRPKGVVLSHQAHLWVVEQRLAAQDLSDERFLIAAPLYHMNGLALAQLACAAHATIVLLPHFETRSYARAIGEHGCTWLTAVPPMLAMMLKDKAAMAEVDARSVRSIRLGSAPVGPALAAAIRAAFPAAKLINAFGTTEGGPVVFGPHPGGLPTPPLSVGYPHPKVELRLRGADGALSETEGVLEQRSPSVMNGYWNRPDLRLPFTEDGFYITGDVFRRDADGFFTVVGRSDDMFICGGENIFPGQVEAVLERHPAVEQAAVVPMPDELKGEKPVAFVVLRPGAVADEASLKAHSLAEAPAYQHPRNIWLLDALPLSGTNKVDKAALMLLARELLGKQQSSGGG